MSDNKDNKEEKHEEDLSRMEGTYGALMISKLKQMHVFISGMTGLGVETAKNLILAGPHSVTLQDNGKTVIADLGVNFYLSESDIGKPRGAATAPFLSKLNPNVNVSVYDGEITEQFLNKFDVVVFTDQSCSPKELLRINDFCHNRTVKVDSGKTEPRPIKFIHATMAGVTTSIFSDFGPNHHSFDTDGEPLRTLIVDHISNAKEGVVTIDGDRHLLYSGDQISLTEVVGMESETKGTPSGIVKAGEPIVDINNCTYSIKTTKNPKKFLIGDTTKLGSYKSGGIIQQLKVGRNFVHKDLRTSLTNPSFEPGYVDFSKFGREYQLHFARLALFKFQEDKGELPRLHNADDAKLMVNYAKAILAGHKALVEAKKEAVVVDEIDSQIITQYSYYARAELTALAALFGGVVAQEISKQTGKYTPISQWLHFDAFELLDEKVRSDVEPIGSRYDHQITIFGKAFQEKIQKQNVFVVGCGALGCEYIKAVSMIGLGTKATVHVTDNDRIELSNLSRQFLFQRKHVGKPKSTSAAEAAYMMNPDMKSALKTYEIKVEPKTEDIFDDNYWESIDIVLNALDNNTARKYTDSKCVLYEKPLFESGTLGTKANSVIVLPHKTPSYSEGAVAGEGQGIAKCTLRNFPSIPLHCIEWAREMFDDWFVGGPDNTNSFLEDPDAFFAKLKASPLEELEILQQVSQWLALSQKSSFETCLSLAMDKFREYFRDGIKDLCYAFPEDARLTTTTDGKEIDMGPFWHGHKRFPQAAVFDPQNDLHVDFLFHCSSIYADIFGVTPGTRAKVIELASEMKMPKWVPSGKKIELDEDDKKDGDEEEEEEEEEKTVSSDDQKAISAITAELSALKTDGLKKMTPADFEKDDDSNHHIDLITAATNLRSFNYKISESTRQQCRMVSGRIIPAIATTTAMITGFVQLEVYKYIHDCKLEGHRAVTANLATNTFCLENLPDPIKTKTGMDQATYMQVTAIPEGFTVWDTVVIEAPGATLGEFLEAFTKQHHGCVIEMLCDQAGKVFYNTSINTEMYEARKKENFLKLIETISEPVFPESRNYVLLDCTCEDDDGNTAVVPRIKYIFK